MKNLVEDALKAEVNIENLKLYLEKNDHNTLMWLALAYEYDSNDYEKEAEKAYQIVWERRLEGIPKEQFSSFYLSFGSTLRNNLKFEESCEILKKGCDLFPKDAPLKGFYALSLYSHGEYQKASEQLLQALTLDTASELSQFEAFNWYVEHLKTHPVLAS